MVRVLSLVWTGTAVPQGKVGVCVTVGRNTENSVVEMIVGNASSLKLTDMNNNGNLCICWIIKCFNVKVSLSR